MKLTDEEILTRIKKEFGRYFEKGHTIQTAIFGANTAREFYENQRCETCSKAELCGILEMLGENLDNFGCNQWKPKNTEII